MIQKKKKKKKAKVYSKKECLQMAQRLARARDCLNGGHCISCGKYMAYEESQGGHYITRQVSCIADDMDNINAQCYACNMMEGGNFVGYRDGLTRKIGIERVQRLEDMFRASRGSEESLERLSENDRLTVTGKRGKKYWDSRYRELKEELKRITGETE